MADEVLTERQGRTLTITINRPEARNTFNTAVSQGLADAMDEMDDKQETIMPVFASTDAMEGATAFAEKRAPNWTGS